MRFFSIHFDSSNSEEVVKSDRFVDIPSPFFVIAENMTAEASEVDTPPPSVIQNQANQKHAQLMI